MPMKPEIAGLMNHFGRVHSVFILSAGYSLRAAGNDKFLVKLFSVINAGDVIVFDIKISKKLLGM